MSHFEFLRKLWLMSIATIHSTSRFERKWEILGNFQTLCSSVSAFRHNLCFTDIHTDNQKDLQELREEKLLFSSFFGDGSSIVEWYRRSYRKCLCFLCCRHKSGLPPSFFEKYSSFSYFFDDTVYKTFFCLLKKILVMIHWEIVCFNEIRFKFCRN